MSARREPKYPPREGFAVRRKPNARRGKRRCACGRRATHQLLRTDLGVVREGCDWCMRKVARGVLMTFTLEWPPKWQAERAREM